MKINEDYLINLIAESVRNALFEDEQNKPYNIEIYKKQNSEDYNYIKEHKDYIYDFLNKGYNEAGLGNYCGCTSAQSLLKNFNIIKIAYYNDTIIALSIYNGYQDGKKCVGITATTDKKFREIGKNAVIDIVKDDVNLYSDFYWSECSGALEHLYKKYGGIMIPNDYIELFIGNKFEKKLNDGYHFSVRFKSNDLDEDDTVINKCIFGFNNRKTYELVKARLDSDIRKRIDFIMNSIEESSNIYKRDKYQAAHDIIYVFYDERCEGVNEFSNEMIDILKDSLHTLEDYIIKNPDDTRIDKFETAIWNAHDILDSSTIIKLNKL